MYITVLTDHKSAVCIQEILNFFKYPMFHHQSNYYSQVCIFMACYRLVPNFPTAFDAKL